MLNIDNRLLDDLKLNENEVFLLLHLTKRINKDRICWPSNETLKRDTGWHIEKILRVKKALSAKKLIRVQRRQKGQVNQYLIATSLLGVYVNGKPDNGKSVISENPIGENPVKRIPENPADVYRKTRQLSIDQEVLISEALIENERRLVFCSLLKCIYSHLLEYQWHSMDPIDSALKDSPTGTTLKKIWEASGKIKRIGSRGATDDDYPFRLDRFHPVSQIEAYADLCRLVNRPVTHTPENLPGKLTEADWCLELKKWADSRFHQRYDPAEDEQLISDWLPECYYDLYGAYVDSADCDRVKFFD